MRRCLVSMVFLLGVSSHAGAQPQPPPPRGPAEVFTQAGEARDAEAQRSRTAATTSTEQAAAADAHPGDGAPAGEAESAAMEAHAQRALGDPQVAVAEPSTEVPSGEVHVSVLDVGGAPANGAPVRLGVMGSAGDRESLEDETDAAGEARFRELSTGSGQAYRVNVLHEGATYSSAPFRLEPDRGHIVRVLRIPVTRDDAAILQWIGGSFIEIKPDRRLHVIQQTELVNLGRETFVTPEGGIHVPLPEGFTAFQSQQVMTDQRFIPDDRGFRLEGSLPPGRVQLTWAFDIPVDGDEVTFAQRIPFRTHQYVVVSDFTPGLELSVAGFPSAHRAEDRGREHLATRIARTPSDEPWERLRVTLRGIPGPGPERTLAVLLALVFVGLSVYFALPKPDDGLEAASLREGRRRELLDEARELEAAYAREEVGPKFHERRRREIIDELAILLGMDLRQAPSPPKKALRSR